MAGRSAPLSLSSQLFLQPNKSRQMYSIQNNSTGNLYINEAESADITSGSYVIKVVAGGYFVGESPTHKGPVSGVWDTGVGSAAINER
jgi:hypothetical protein